jgi:hypothetical protein
MDVGGHGPTLFDTAGVAQNADCDRTTVYDGWSATAATTVADMRKTLIASSLVLVGVGGLAGGVTAARDSGAAPAAPGTTQPGLDILTDIGFDPEQLQCFITNIGSVGADDSTALFDVMSQCGISMDQLLSIGLATGETLPVAPEASAPVVPVSSVAIDPATATAALDALGLDPVALECLTAASTPSPPADDASAEAIFEACGVGPLQVLEGILALDAATIGSDVTATTVPATIAEETPATVIETGNAMVDLLLQQFAERGIELDPAQAECLLDNIADLNPNDLAASLGVFEACGISINDLVPGG